MRRDTQAVVLLLFGATLLKISFAGSYVRYVKPGLLVLLVVAGAVLITVAGFTLWQGMRRPGQPPDGDAAVERAAHASSANGDHDVPTEPHAEPRVGWLLVIPALVLLLFAPPALGSYQASRNGTALSTRSDSDFAPLAAGDPVRLALLDYAARAVFDQGRSLAGRRVRLTGFVIAGPQGRPYLTRLVVGCCAADARPVKIGLAGDVPTGLVADQWIEVEGTFTERVDRDTVNSEIIPYLQVVEFRAIDAPDQPYES